MNSVINQHKLQSLFRKYPEIKLVYLFGSQVSGDIGPLSDYDFAVYFSEKISSSRRWKVVLKLNAELMSLLKVNQVDIVDLNSQVEPLLKYNAIRYGRLIYEIPPYKVLLEPQIYNEYFDYKTFLDMYSL